MADRFFQVKYDERRFVQVNGKYRIEWGDVYLSRAAAEAWLNREENLYTIRNFMNGSYVFDICELTWQEREQMRFNQVYYTELPWARDRKWLNCCNIWQDQFPHVSVDDPSMVAFTASEAHGEQDRQTRMRPGKYLKKYFADHLDDKTIAFMAEWFQNGQRPVAPVDAELKFATTPDEIAMVYTECIAHSCMDKRHFRNPDTHPARVYGAGDLAVAYLQRASGEVIARALCWPEKKVIGRIYPTVGSGEDAYEGGRDEQQNLYDHVMQTLRRDGYNHYTEGVSLSGARLLKIEDQYGNHRMPYLDGDYGVNDDGDYWIMSQDYEFGCGNTNGYIDEDASSDDDMYSCDNCGDDTDETYSVVLSVRSGRAWSFGDWCYSCYNDNTYYCEGLQATVADGVDSVEACGCTFCLSWFEANGGYTCQRYERSYLVSDDPPVTMANHETWSPDAFEDEGFYCAYDGQNYPIEGLSETWAGFPEKYDDDLAVTILDRMRHHPANPENQGPVRTYYGRQQQAHWPTIGHMIDRMLGRVTEEHEPEEEAVVEEPQAVDIVEFLSNPAVHEIVALTAPRLSWEENNRWQQLGAGVVTWNRAALITRTGG